MLSRTFCHLPGVGPATEEKLWRAGVRTWDDFLAADASLVSARKKALTEERLAESHRRLASGDADFFAGHLPAKEQWRLLSDFSDSVAYVDIETTGLGMGLDHITTIALYDGNTARTYVHGRNLEDFEADIADYKLIVTYNGKCFDVPFIEREFCTSLQKAHIDLRYLLKSVGLTGGLKGCERALGIGRDELDGVDGYFAVLLWQEYGRSRDERVLETLLAYNVADVLSLERLLFHAANKKLEDTPFYAELCMDAPPGLANPHVPDTALVERIKAFMVPAF